MVRKAKNYCVDDGSSSQVPLREFMSRLAKMRSYWRNYEARRAKCEMEIEIILDIHLGKHISCIS